MHKQTVAVNAVVGEGFSLPPICTRTKTKASTSQTLAAVRGRWHRCRMNIEFLIVSAPMTEGVSYLHENYLTIIVKLSFNSARNIKVWFSCWCATLPPLRGPPPLHSKLRRGGNVSKSSVPLFKLRFVEALRGGEGGAFMNALFPCCVRILSEIFPKNDNFI